MVKLCFINELQSGVGYHRLQIPFGNLNQTHKDLEITGTNGFTKDLHPKNFDIIVLNRHYKHDEDYLKKAKDHKVKIILDLDDWIELPSWHSGSKDIRQSIIKKIILDSIDYADVIWTASPVLQDEIQKLTDTEVICIENGIDFTQPQFQLQRKKQDKYTIGWIGAANHHKDIEKLNVPFSKLLKNKNHKLLLGGYTEESKDYWSYIEQIFTTDFTRKPDQYIRVESLDVRNYAIMYNLLYCALAPLINDTYSTCKSSLKVLEAGAFNLPIIVSNSIVYDDFIDKDLVIVSEGNWDGKMRELISNPSKGVKLGKQLGEYVRQEYDINKLNKLRYDSIIKLMD